MNSYPLKEARKYYMGIGFRMLILTVIVYSVQFIMALGVELLNIKGDEFVMQLIISGISIYLIGYPSLLLMFRKHEKQEPARNPMGAGTFFAGIFQMAALTGVGAIIGLIVHLVIVNAMNMNINDVSDASGIVNLLLNSSFWLRVLFVGVLAPIFEELIFRKTLIDNCAKYGQWPAIIISGLFFGLFHGNFQQFFFATFIGMFFAYIYLKTGNIVYTILYHMAMNLTTSIVTVYVISGLDMEAYQEITLHPEYFQDISLIPDNIKAALPGVAAYLLWIMFLCLICMIGVVIWVIMLSFKKMHVERKETDLPVGKAVGTVFTNAGVILYMIAWAAMFAFTYFAMTL